MKTRLSDSRTRSRTWIRRIGLVVAATGLAIGGLALNQCLTRLLETAPPATQPNWLMVEGMACVVLTWTGFGLMVLGADYWNVTEGEPTEFPDRNRT